MGHHEAAGHDAHGAAPSPKEESKSWAWMPFLLGFSFIMILLFMPLVQYQGSDISFQPVDPQSLLEGSNEKAVYTAVEKALEARFSALGTGNTQAIKESFGTATYRGTVMDALGEEQRLVDQFRPLFKAEGIGQPPQLNFVVYDMKVNGDQAKVVLRYMVQFISPINGTRTFQDIEVWEMAKFQSGWKVIGEGTFSESSSSGKVVKAAQNFLSDVNSGKEDKALSWWEQPLDPYGQQSAKHIKSLLGKNISWQVGAPKFFTLGEQDNIALRIEDASLAQVIVQGTIDGKTENHVLVMVKERKGNSIFTPPTWRILLFASERELLGR